MFIVDGADGNSTPHLHTIDRDKNLWASGSGCFNIYNHSETPNINKKMQDPSWRADDKVIYVEMIALKDITANEELRSRYNSRKWRECFKNLED